MRFDFFAHFDMANKADLDKARKNKQLDIYTHMLLMHALDCQNGTDNARDSYKRTLHQNNYPSLYSRNMITDPGAAFDLMGQLGLLGIADKALNVLPSCAVFLQFEFALEKNFLSRDDAPFYPIENPIRKERTFKVPMLSGSSWKGALRAAAVDAFMAHDFSLHQKIGKRLDLIEIFGDEKSGDEGSKETGKQRLKEYLDEWLGDGKEQFEKAKQLRFGQTHSEKSEFHRKGRVRCLPSYFNGIDLDLINPRNRKTRTGTLPILMEIVPKGCRANFGVVYFPFDLLGQEEGAVRKQLRRDWNILGEAIFHMFRISGFGARKTSGCGKAQMDISNFRFESGMPNFHLFDLQQLDQMVELGNCFEVVP